MTDDLNSALNLHQCGLLDQAVQVCQALLAQNPNHADAVITVDCPGRVAKLLSPQTIMPVR
jgi:hypothetical protein